MSGVRSSCDMFAMNSDLYFDETASWPAFSSTSRFDSSTSWFLLLGLDVLLGEQAGLAPEVLVRLAQLFLLRAQLLGLRLRLLEQVLGERVGFDRVEHEADALGELVEERLVGDAERRERRELDDRAHRALEQHRQHDDVERRRLAEPGVDPHVVAGHLGEQDALLLLRALADEALAERGTTSERCLRSS